MFHLMPRRELPADFEQRYPSVWVTPPWWELAVASRVGPYDSWTLDELLHAARAGVDGEQLLRPLKLSAPEIDDLVAFFETLTDPTATRAFAAPGAGPR